MDGFRRLDSVSFLTLKPKGEEREKTSIALGLTMLLAQVNGHAFESDRRGHRCFAYHRANQHPAQQCWDRNPADDSSRAAATQLPRAIIGGVPAPAWQHRRQGNGRVAAAAVGAEWCPDRRQRRQPEFRWPHYHTTTPVQRCRQVDNFETITTGYW